MIDEGVGGRAGGEEFLAATDLVFEGETQAGALAHGGEDRDDVVVNGGAAIPHVDLDDGEAEAGGLEVAVGQALLAEEGGAADLEPGQVITVIDDAHHVGFGVANGDFGAGLQHGANLKRAINGGESGRSGGVGREEGARGGGPIVAQSPSAAGLAEAVAEFGLGDEFLEGGGELRGVMGRD